MQAVSNAWKANQRRTIVSEGFVEVLVDIGDPAAIADVSSQDNGSAYISNTQQVVSEGDKNIAPYSTLEQNMWVLNDSRKILPTDDYGDCGYIGDALSNEYCAFVGKTPILTLNFTRVHNNLIPAITITWSKTYGEYATDFTVRAYNGTSLVAEKEVVGNKSTQTIVEMDIVGYDRITISILKWCLPRHRARIEEVFVGLQKVYSKSDLFGYTHSQTVDPVSTSLPKAEVSFAVDNTKDTYNPDNTDGLAKYFMERQLVKTRYGYKMNDNSIEWIKGGVFYLSEWSATQNGREANFTARDILEYLTQRYVDSVTSVTERSLYDLAETILMSADLPLNPDGSVKWKLDDSLKNIRTTAPLPDDTMANCLLLIANAGRCVFYQDRSGILHIEPLTGDVVDCSITTSNSYTLPEITIGKPIEGISVKVYQYALCERGFESTTTEQYITVGGKGERVEVDNPLVTDVTVATAILEWMRDYLANRMTVDTSWRADVRLDALDKVKVGNRYGESDVIVTDVEYSFGGTFRGATKGRRV